MNRYPFAFDFGFSGLTGWFYGAWQLERTALETVDDAATDRSDEPPGSEASALRSDTVRLLESSLVTAHIATLWRAASYQGPNTVYFGGDARDWLHQIVEVCERKLNQLDVPVASTPRNTGPREKTEQVLREILCVREKLTSPTDSTRHMDPTGAVAEALEEVVSTVDDDLGFRLFLRVLNTYRIPLSQDQYTRFQGLSEYFGYGEFHVHDVEWLTRQT
ncbi:hypothetical protein ABZ829_33650 [Streptomyces xanthochromogenes]|uniref:hypothetical protein n=1 Tax=Streptomyces xanthochromogenes TaxID=67384 RepID=UPI003428FD7E